MVEILLIKINYTKNLKGIRYAKRESRSETFADDTTVILERSEEYLRYALKCLVDFHKLSGLQCNIDKTMVIPIGEITDPTIKICEDINLEWASEFKICNSGGPLLIISQVGNSTSKNFPRYFVD